MDTKTLLLSCATLLTSVTGNIAHANGGGFTVHARVLNVQPVYRYVTIKEPKRHCEVVHNRQPRNYRTHGYQHQGYQNQGFQNQQFRSNSRRNNSSAAIVGGVIGGVIGNQVTRSNNGGGRVAATIAGAAIGATLAKAAADKGKSKKQRFNSNQGFSGHQVNGNQRHRNGTKRCHTTYVTRKERRHNGYDVTYFHKGRKFHTRTDYHPGKRIAVRVNRRRY